MRETLLGMISALKVQKLFTYEQMLDYAHQFLSRDNPRRLAVLFEGVVSPANDFHYEAVSKEDICDLGTYVSWK